ncbi:thaumatin-like protein 1 isoform X2 [Panicum hallii]|uniref:thaumatin-like protein 1 isoform X2 n=1 Tax=Panicum hallii TaxID=206008 RepID=UPI000DF4E9B2|nr:thaumatin-like protein 1 isoform X2 [Panicum hallii]
MACSRSRLLGSPASIAVLILSFFQGSVCGITFTFTNRCPDTVWPGLLSGSGTPPLETTGFALAPGQSRSLPAPQGWSGRFWGRSGCDFDASGKGSCATGDCGSGEVECRGAGASPPATLAEFTLDGAGGKDFYDVSLVDGYNLPMLVQAAAPDCPDTGCLVDLNERCPDELRADDGRACRSACEAFGSPEYCCNGAYGNPNTCHPSQYSQLFKSACPKSYSYAYDDATSTFTCNHTDYTITFCPKSTPSRCSPLAQIFNHPARSVFTFNCNFELQISTLCLYEIDCLLEKAINPNTHRGGRAMSSLKIRFGLLP